MGHDNDEEPKVGIMKTELISVDASVKMDEIAAIKVSKWEENLLTGQMQHRKLLQDKEAELAKLQEELPKLVDKDTRKSYPEIEDLESSLKSLFGKTVHMSIVLHGDKVNVSISGALSALLTWKGQDSKDHKKKIDAVQKEIKEIEDKLCEIKKGLGMLPYLERRAKAAVAEAKLSKSKEGAEILKSLDKLMLPGLPGLPAPK